MPDFKCQTLSLFSCRLQVCQGNNAGCAQTALAKVKPSIVRIFYYGLSNTAASTNK